jgi:uncharacterized protein YceH (UPF0502 family)
MRPHSVRVRRSFILATTLIVAGCSDKLSDAQTDQAYDVATNAIVESDKIEDLEATLEELETRIGELEDRLDNANIE